MYFKVLFCFVCYHGIMLIMVLQMYNNCLDILDFCNVFHHYSSFEVYHYSCEKYVEDIVHIFK